MQKCRRPRPASGEKISASLQRIKTLYRAKGWLGCPNFEFRRRCCSEVGQRLFEARNDSIHWTIPEILDWQFLPPPVRRVEKRNLPQKALPPTPNTHAPRPLCHR